MEGEGDAPCQAGPLKVPLLTVQLCSLWSLGTIHAPLAVPASPGQDHRPLLVSGLEQQSHQESCGTGEGAARTPTPRPWRRLDQTGRPCPQPPACPVVSQKASGAARRPGAHTPLTLHLRGRQESKPWPSAGHQGIQSGVPRTGGYETHPPLKAQNSNRNKEKKQKKKTESCSLSGLALPWEKGRRQNSRRAEPQVDVTA